MQETLQKIKDLKAKIDNLTTASKKHNELIEAMTLQANEFPEDVKAFIDHLPSTITDRIHQALDQEFNISLSTINPKPILSKVKRPIRGIRI